MRTTLLALVSLLAYGSAETLQPKRSGMSMTLPIKKRMGQSLLNKRKTTAVGLGDEADLQWAVEMSLGGVDVPLILDTGSSDLWSLSSDCTSTSCGNITGFPLISSSAFKPAGFDYRVDYGDSSLPTFASGITVSGAASFAGIQLNNQFLGAVNTTNSLSGALTGILGVGFPTISAIVKSLLTQAGVSSSNKTDILNAQLADQGPFLTRLIATGQLDQPMFTITLQRDSFDLGGDIGQLTIGKLPDGVSNDSLTWVPVRLYSQEQGGFPPSSDSPDERYPLTWEVPIDDVILNGQTLPKPELNASVGYTALIDSGTSTLRGPANTVQALYSALSTDTANFNSSNGPSFDCTKAVQLTYVIGGKQFPVDPRDFVGHQEIKDCTISTVGPTDAPSEGNLTLTAFYFGNLTHPSVDPPRIGFLSTVPSNAADLFNTAVAADQKNGVPGITDLAPTGTFTAGSTNSAGVGQAPSQSAAAGTGNKSSSYKVEIPSLLFTLVIFATFSL
ncbi:hypothetical protein M422DRAFT_778570 [Sphaerobolus stellatus SS14]|uniref:Peptidase A1 domain-containing protein n=1 Tax=Sphaerobolus stellatus (strain SS14) TaxID=990650 RepID=A0A0C9VTT4_SPHS4|nr:hypothetical protein M422DRAFT_778570 [Sphaerobolus stellatus SS14]